MRVSSVDPIRAHIDFEERLPRHESGKLYTRKLRDPYWQGRERKI